MIIGTASIVCDCVSYVGVGGVVAGGGVCECMELHVGGGKVCVSVAIV